MERLTSRAQRRRGGSATAPASLSREQRPQVEVELRRGKVEKRVYLRAQPLLMMADGTPANRIAWTLRVHERMVAEWRRRFRQADPVAMLADAPRAGRPHSLSPRRTAHA